MLVLYFFELLFDFIEVFLGFVMDKMIRRNGKEVRLVGEISELNDKIVEIRVLIDSLLFMFKDLKDVVFVYCFESLFFVLSFYLLFDLIGVVLLYVVVLWVFNVFFLWYLYVVFWFVYWIC